MLQNTSHLLTSFGEFNRNVIKQTLKIIRANFHAFVKFESIFFSINTYFDIFVQSTLDLTLNLNFVNPEKNDIVVRIWLIVEKAGLDNTGCC